MREVAVIGGGTAGLVCAHALRGACRVTLYEAAPRLGGHVHAVEGVETGFLAFHRSRYPTLARLLAEFEVETGPSGVGLTVQDLDGGLRFEHADWMKRDDLPAELRPQFAGLFAWILRHERKPDQHPIPNVSLAELLAGRGTHPELARLILVPAIAALWGFQPDEVLAMSAVTVLASLGRFIGATHDEPFERIVPSTDAWLGKLAASLDAEILLNSPVRSVTQDGRVTTARGTRSFDAVVLALHADRSLALLSAPTPEQHRLLGAIPYRQTTVVLHDDFSIVPEGRAAYTVRLENDVCTTTWDMVQIQGPPWLVTVGPPDDAWQPVDPARVRFRTRYTHPAMVPGAIAAVPHLPTLNAGQLRFCGSYFGTTGSNEDAAASGLAAAHSLKASP